MGAENKSYDELEKTPFNKMGPLNKSGDARYTKANTHNEGERTPFSKMKGLNDTKFDYDDGDRVYSTEVAKNTEANGSGK